MTKYLLALGAGAGLIFFMIVFWPISNEVWTTANTTYAGSNFTGLSQGIRFTPLFLWFGIISVPLIVIAVLAWRGQQGRLF